MFKILGPLALSKVVNILRRSEVDEFLKNLDVWGQRSTLGTRIGTRIGAFKWKICNIIKFKVL